MRVVPELTETEGSGMPLRLTLMQFADGGGGMVHIPIGLSDTFRDSKVVRAPSRTA